MSDWISVSQAAKIIGVQTNQVRKLCNSGTLICEKPGAYWIVDETSAIAYAQSERKTGPKPSKYTPDLTVKQIKENGDAYKQYEVTVLLTTRQLQHLIEKHGSVPAGLRTLISKDMD